MNIRPQDIRWKVNNLNKDKTKALMAGYIDARTCMELLDSADPKWGDVYTIVQLGDAQGVQCALTVNGVTRTDVGLPSNLDALKGAYSDALKRAAVKHGIGRDLYDLPTIWVRVNDRGYHMCEPTWKGDRWTVPPDLGTVFYDHPPPRQEAPLPKASIDPETGEGVYVDERTGNQVDPETGQITKPAANGQGKGLSGPQMNRLWGIAHRGGYDRAMVNDLIHLMAESISKLTREQYDTLCNHMEARKPLGELVERLTQADGDTAEPDPVDSFTEPPPPAQMDLGAAAKKQGYHP